MMDCTTALSIELAQLAARHIAEEGLTYGQAKRKAAKQAGLSQHGAAMPCNEAIEHALRNYLLEYQADTQPQELAFLRELAIQWLERLPLLHGLNEPCVAWATGAVVNGTANEHSAVHLQVFTEEDKLLEIALIDSGYELEHTDVRHTGERSSGSNGGMRHLALVAQDQGVPIVLTILPRNLYIPPKSVVGENEIAQYATAAQLRQILALST